MRISCGLTALALVLALLARKPACWLAALAMAVSTVADALLAGHPKPFAPVRHKLIKGGLVFFAAHIVYIIALIRITGQRAEALLPFFWGPFAVFAALAALHGALFYAPARARVSPVFFAAALFYLLTVSVHAGAAFGVWTQTGRCFLNTAGTVLFFLSDAVLLARRYGAVGYERATDVIWLTYIPAQLCLMLGFYLA